MSSLSLCSVDSPIGRLTLVADGDALLAVDFPHQHPSPARRGEPVESSTHPVLNQAARELAEYFAGTRQIFTTRLSPQGTPFQRTVWQQLTTIPFGTTCSYGQIAAAIARPKAVRAVGAANGQNPLPLFIPCHRVIGARGDLTGFAGGLPLKRWLLAHEEGFVARQLELRPALKRDAAELGQAREAL